MTCTHTSPCAHLERTGAQSEFMTQPGLGPKPPAGLGPALSSQPSLPAHPGPAFPPGAKSCPGLLGPWALRGLASRPSFTCCKLALDMFGTSTDLSFFSAVASPQPPSYLGIVPLHSRTCDCSLPVSQHPIGRERVSSPTPAGEGRICIGGRDLAVG